jgi:hypothetical protein
VRVAACDDCRRTQFRIEFDSSGFSADMGPNKSVVYNDWKTYWDWASIERIRQSIISGETFTDPDLMGYRVTSGTTFGWAGCDKAPGGCNAVAALVGWIRSGYRSGNPQAKAGCAGQYCTQPDIGAAPYGGIGRRSSVNSRRP